MKGPDGQYALINNAFFPVSNQAGFNQTQFSTKSDYNLTSKHRSRGSFVFVDRPRTLLDQGGVWDFNDPTADRCPARACNGFRRTTSGSLTTTRCRRR